MRIDVTERLPLTPVELALAGLLLVLERRVPGLADDWVDTLESEALHAEVRRLHGPVPDPAVAHSLHEAVAVVVKARAIVKSHGVEAKRRAEPKRKKGRG